MAKDFTENLRHNNVIREKLSAYHDGVAMSSERGLSKEFDGSRSHATKGD